MQVEKLFTLIAALATVSATNVSTNSEDKCIVRRLDTKEVQSTNRSEAPVLSAGCNRAAIQLAGEVVYNTTNTILPIDPLEVLHFDYTNNDTLAYLVLEAKCLTLNMTFETIKDSPELEMRNISIQKLNADIFKQDGSKLQEPLHRCRVDSVNTRTTNGSFECKDLVFDCFCSTHGKYVSKVKLGQLKVELKRNVKTAPKNVFESTVFGECKNTKPNSSLIRKRRSADQKVISNTKPKVEESKQRYWSRQEHYPKKEESMELFELLSRAERWAP